MAKSVLVQAYLASGFCLLGSVIGGCPSFAQSIPQAGASPAAVSQGCAGVLCALTPGSMERPILAEEATRIEDDRARTTQREPVAAPSAIVSSRAARKRHPANAHPHAGHATDGRSVAARSIPIGHGRTTVASAGPINEIFVLAPRPFDPFGGDYLPWLDRLAWPSRPDRAGDRTVFSVEGYREADTAPAQAVVFIDQTEDLTRRSNALSLKSFEALKADLAGG